MGVPWRTRAAWVAVWVYGWLRHVKTYQRYWTMDHETLEPVPGGWHWYEWRPAQRVLSFVFEIDRVHFDHWGVQNRDESVYCVRCKSFYEAPWPRIRE